MFFLYSSNKNNEDNKNIDYNNVDNLDPDLISDHYADGKSNTVNNSISSFYLVFGIIVASLSMTVILNPLFKKWNLFGWYK